MLWKINVSDRKVPVSEIIRFGPEPYFAPQWQLWLVGLVACLLQLQFSVDSLSGNNLREFPRYCYENLN